MSASAKNRQIDREWTHGLFECTERNSGMDLFCGCLCPPCLECRSFNETPCGEHGMMYALATCCGCEFCYSWSMRSQFRKKHGIKVAFFLLFFNLVHCGCVFFI